METFVKRNVKTEAGILSMSYNQFREKEDIPKMFYCVIEMSVIMPALIHAGP